MTTLLWLQALGGHGEAPAGFILGVSLWLSVVNVEYRDVQQAMPLLTQAWMFATPVVYPASLVPEAWRPLYALNPMVTVMADRLYQQPSFVRTATLEAS